MAFPPNDGVARDEHLVRRSRVTLQLEAVDRGRDEQAELAQKVFELSQSLHERWLTADCPAKRQILQIVCLNFKLDGATLVTEINKPFDSVIEGLHVSSSRGDKTPIELFVGGTTTLNIALVKHLTAPTTPIQRHGTLSPALPTRYPTR